MNYAELEYTLTSCDKLQFTADLSMIHTNDAALQRCLHTLYSKPAAKGQQEGHEGRGTGGGETRPEKENGIEDGKDEGHVGGRGGRMVRW
jgi:hypothetical protein